MKACIYFAAMLSIAGCTTGGGVVEPKIFSFDYQIREVSSQTVTQWRSSLRADRANVEDFVVPQRVISSEEEALALALGAKIVPNVFECKFLASFASGNARPELDINGAPGTTGARLRIAVTNPTDAARDDQSSAAPENSPCRDRITYIDIMLGPPINPREEVKAVSAILTIDGVNYETGLSGYIEGELFGVRSTGYATGRFDIIARAKASGDERVLILSNGAFAIRD